MSPELEAMYFGRAVQHATSAILSPLPCHTLPYPTLSSTPTIIRRLNLSFPHPKAFRVICVETMNGNFRQFHSQFNFLPLLCLPIFGLLDDDLRDSKRGVYVLQLRHPAHAKVPVKKSIKTRGVSRGGKSSTPCCS